MSGENVQSLEDELAELDQVSAPVVDIAEPVESEVAAPETEAPEKKEVSVPEPAEPAPVEPAAVVEPPAPAETKPETSQVEELMKQVDMLSQQILQLQTKVPQPQTKSDTPEKLPEVEVYDYLEGIDIDDVTTDPKLFNTVLSKIEARVRGVLAEETTRSTLLAIPDVAEAAKSEDVRVAFPVSVAAVCIASFLIHCKAIFAQASIIEIIRLPAIFLKACSIVCVPRRTPVSI